MMSQYMEELEQEPFNSAEFIERLTWRTNKEIGLENFDPLLLHDTFTQTIKDLQILQERQQRKCERLEEVLKNEQSVLAKNIDGLQERHQVSVDWFHQLDEKINSVAGKIIHLGEQLENVNTPRSRTVEALGLLNHMTEFLTPGPIVNDLFNDKTKLLESADIIQKLYMIAQDLPIEKFGDAKKKIEAKYDEIERSLIEEFAAAQKHGNIDKMKSIATILSQFKGYSQCIDAYIEQSQMTPYGGKDIFVGIVPMCRLHYGVIKQVFASPDQVMSKFILNIYQLKLFQYAQTKLEDRRDEDKYLKTLFELYSRTTKLSTELVEFMVGSDEDLLTKLTANIFAKHLSTYFETEKKSLDSKCSNELKKYYDGKKHQKKQAERFQDLRRDVQALIGTRANINIAQIEDYGGETFLSEELAINLLQESKGAFRRCRLLSKESELPSNIVRLADILLRYLMHEHVDYAIDLGLQAIPLGESKNFPHVYFFDVVQKCNTIVVLLEKLYNASVFPCVESTVKYADCVSKKRIMLDQIESKLDTGLDRSINAFIGWIKVYLQNEQKKSDFRPDTDVDTVASPACLHVVQNIMPVILQFKRCVDGENLSAIMKDFGIRFHRVILENFQQFQFNTAGAMCAICDVNEYRKCVRVLNSPLVIQLFDILHALCNLLLVKHENLPEVCGGETLNYLDKSVVLNFIQLRSDYKTIKISNSLKGISDQRVLRYSSKNVLQGTNAIVLEQMYNQWKVNKSSVHPSWNRVFESDPYWSGQDSTQIYTNLSASSDGGLYRDIDALTIQNHINVHALIKCYQQRGHLVADLDPLGITTVSLKEDHGIKRRADASVTKNYFNFSASNMEKEFFLPPSTFIAGPKKKLKLREIIQNLENAYCNKIGIEYMHVNDHKRIRWIRERFETPGCGKFSNEDKKLILARLTRATGFETFLQKKYQSEKRFGLEGCEMIIPALKEIIDFSSIVGVESVILGMAHRGRLNVLSNVCRKPLDNILTQFAGLQPTDSGCGDVKYHLGTYIERINRISGKPIKLAIVANPSHLEAVDPVVQGRTKAEQFYKGDTEGNTIMSILIHGDASNCGQGVVYETMHLTDLPDYTTRGTIHAIINNQIGFTTDPRYSRSSRYCTDVAKVVNAPILHVNADDPEAVIYCAKVCAEWRHTFHSDIVLDLVCYRRNGHNEIDEPMFTQPLMYQRIAKLKTCYELYSEKLIAEGVISQSECKEVWDEYQKICEEAHSRCLKETTIKFKDWIDSAWGKFFDSQDPNVCPSTGVQESTLKHIGDVFSSPPLHDPQFVLHRGIQRVLAGRKRLIESRQADWALGEAFAVGSWLKDKIHVRISGQDVERGTFSHRHHYLHSQTKDKTWYCPLQHIYPDQGAYRISNSSLSEYAVLGFEHGYSMANANSLVIWEAQFGDFANTAQCIIDQFISSGESKWVRQSGLVMLLPHGMEGMGPEHSSCRIERFLQLSDDDADNIREIEGNYELEQLREINWIVANCSTPASLFHILRRQVALPFRKPLIIATPKSLLRLPACRSSFDDMIENTSFKRLIPDDTIKDTKKVTKLVFCTGKTFYDLEAARNEREMTDNIALVRIEQICPFPYDLVRVELKKYPHAKVAWAQEEHKNSGCWSYLQPRLSTILDSRCLLYYGRPPSSAPATGSIHRFLWEQEQYLSSLFGSKSNPGESNKKPNGGSSNESGSKSSGGKSKESETKARKSIRPLFVV